MPRAWILSVLLSLLLLEPAAAQQGRHTPGKFDFYLLALSWSPSFCEQAGDRPNARQQCGARPFSFVVHGLWPQYERGFPQSCQNPPPFVENRTVDRMLDLMPARGLVIHEWKKHGTCAGGSPEAYFDTVRKAREAVKIPAEYQGPTRALNVAPGAVEEAFIKANPGLSPAGIAVTCSSTRLSEVRICMTRDLKFRDCHEVDRQACARPQVVMPPVRGG
jgi:ribonuclease T2